MSAPLDRLLATAAALFGTSATDIRLGWDERALAALGGFGWLACRCSPASTTDIARHAGRPLSLLLDMIGQFEAHLAAHPAEGERFALEAHALTASIDIDRTRKRLGADRSPEDIARLLVKAGPSALAIGAAQLRALGAAYLALVQTNVETGDAE